MMFSASLEAKPFPSPRRRARSRSRASSARRAFPDIPTAPEAANLPDFQAIFWQGMGCRPGTPKPIADKLQAAIAKVAGRPEVIERFKNPGVEIRSSTPEEFKTFLP